MRLFNCRSQPRYNTKECLAELDDVYLVLGSQGSAGLDIVVCRNRRNSINSYISSSNISAISFLKITLSVCISH